MSEILLPSHPASGKLLFRKKFRVEQEEGLQLDLLPALCLAESVESSSEGSVPGAGLWSARSQRCGGSVQAGGGGHEELQPQPCWGLAVCSLVF